MNRVCLTGRLTADPVGRLTQGQQPMMVVHATLAVDRNRKDANGNSQADFIRIVVFGSRAEWMTKYCCKGMKLEVVGRWQTGSFTDQQGNKAYTNDCVCDEVNFGESKSASQGREGGYQGGGYQSTGQSNGTPQNGFRSPQGQYQQQSMFQNGPNGSAMAAEGFMHIPDNVEDEGLPFN